LGVEGKETGEGKMRAIIFTSLAVALMFLAQTQQANTQRNRNEFWSGPIVPGPGIPSRASNPTQTSRQPVTVRRTKKK
jgi:hypothetical protein